MRIAEMTAFTVLVAAGIAGTASAAVIDNVSALGSSTVRINFETNGAGAPIVLIQGATQVLPANEYASLGVIFDRDLKWVNDGNALFDAAQTLQGSPVTAIPSSQINTFTINFTIPVYGVGFNVINNDVLATSAPVFVANYAGGGSETATWGAQFKDNVLANTVSYGFMGFSGSRAITSITVTKSAATLDDLTFTSVPGPAGLAVAGVAGMLASRRRRA